MTSGLTDHSRYSGWETAAPFVKELEVHAWLGAADLRVPRSRGGYAVRTASMSFPATGLTSVTLRVTRALV
jgi:hypothetical protein